VGLALTIVLLILRMSLEFALWMVVLLAVLGGIAAFVFGSSTKGDK
jgi:hypothetical protein